MQSVTSIDSEFPVSIVLLPFDPTSRSRNISTSCNRQSCPAKVAVTVERNHITLPVVFFPKIKIVYIFFQVHFLSPSKTTLSFRVTMLQ